MLLNYACTSSPEDYAQYFLFLTISQTSYPGAACRQFVRGRQEDAHELLRCMLEAVERDLLRGEGRWPVPKPKPGAPPCHQQTLVSQLFGGLLQSQVRSMVLRSSRTANQNDA